MEPSWWSYQKLGQTLQRPTPASSRWGLAWLYKSLRMPLCVPASHRKSWLSWTPQMIVLRRLRDTLKTLSCILATGHDVFLLAAEAAFSGQDVGVIRRLTQAQGLFVSVLILDDLLGYHLCS